jgi:hypothetical protein
MLLEHGIALPMDRVRFVNDGDAVDVGDRVLRAVLPPIFDNPTTRGLFDPTTGFFWGGDCFAAPVPDLICEADDVPADLWREGFLGLHRMLAPWHTMLDHRRFGVIVDRVQSLGITVAAGAWRAAGSRPCSSPSPTSSSPSPTPTGWPSRSSTWAGSDGPSGQENALAGLLRGR